MDLLTGNQNTKKTKSKNQKIVLSLLIISIVLLILTILLIIFLPQLGTENGKNLKLKINYQDVQTSQEFIVTASNGKNFVELRELSNLLNYAYYNGAYLEFSENKNKCYIDNGHEIIGFEKDSNKIYKTIPEEELDYQYYELSSNIISHNNKLYIKIEDLPVALNLLIENNSINTPEKFAEKYKEKIAGKGYSIDTDSKNLKCFSYNLIVVSKDSKKGILSTNLTEIAGTKYDTIQFNEKTKDFIVSSNNKYGIIKSNSETKLMLMYEEIKIINYEPLLYQVKREGKLGIVNADGKTVANTEYDGVGYPKNEQKGINYTLIIPSDDETRGNMLVVAKNQKYGLIEIKTGKTIIECNTNGIYQLKQNEETKYVVNIGGQEYNLTDYFRYARNNV